MSIRSYVPDEALRICIGRARAFAFLSEYEGFGHPPLEALASGVPPVLLDTPVAREVCGTRRCTSKPGDIAGIGVGAREPCCSTRRRARASGRGAGGAGALLVGDAPQQTLKRSRRASDSI